MWTWRKLNPQLLDRAALSKLARKRRSESCLIVGNGPSLREMDLNLAEKCDSFASNGIYLLYPHTRWRPTAYACVDTAVLPDSRFNINEMVAEERRTQCFFPRCLVPHSDEVSSTDVASYVNPKRNTWYFETATFSTEEAKYNVFSGSNTAAVTESMTVTIVLMQLAVKLGYKRLYLIGCDTAYKIPPNARNLDVDTERVDKRLVLDADNDPNHFDPRYFGKDRVWHTPNTQLMTMHYELVNDFCKNIGIEIYNAGIGGALEVFPRVDYRSIMLNWS